MIVCNRSFLKFAFETSKGKVILGGKHQSNVLNAEYYTQEIADDVWNEIAVKYKDLPEFKEDIIFALKSEKEVKAKAKDVVNKIVGDEQSKPYDKDVDDK